MLDTQKHREGVEYFCKLFQIEFSSPSIEHVTGLLRKFSLLPYENISKILNLNRNWNENHFRWPQEIISDYEKYKLGGTCFSLTFFLKAILDYFGYRTQILMADMKAGRNTHCALLLEFKGRKYLLDPGYLLHYPLPLDSPVIFGKVRLEYDQFNDKYTLATIENGKRKWRYSFQEKATSLEDFSYYWEDSFHWMTMHGICLSRRDQESFIYLHNHYLKMENSSEHFKGNLNTEIAELAQRWFNIPPEIVRQAEKALRENLYQDQKLGYQVPKWFK
ncbi:MAG TPA: arylamine N-acetyltransferase [Candidatus Marinimicrobia bacterium]|nr:arylamine N-acetyltransferase [Candidatus Neomarinimicrobiota bacterium]